MIVNEVETWSTTHLSTVLGVTGIAIAFAIVAIHRSDAPLRRLGLPASSALEWAKSPAHVTRIVSRYRHAAVVSVVVRGILLDTVLLVPAYSVFLAIGCFWSARALASPWAPLGVVLGWLGGAAGYFDLIENAGMLSEVVGEQDTADASVARLTRYACRTKWLLFSLAATFIVLASSTQWICGNVCRSRDVTHVASLLDVGAMARWIGILVGW